MERAQILVLTLCGHIGKKGSGITGFPYLGLAGTQGLYQAPGYLPPRLGLMKLGLDNAPAMIRGKLAGHSLEMILADLGREELIAAMVEHPRLIERPIVIANGKAAIGRPPEKVLEIL